MKYNNTTTSTIGGDLELDGKDFCQCVWCVYERYLLEYGEEGEAATASGSDSTEKSNNNRQILGE